MIISAATNIQLTNQWFHVQAAPSRKHQIFKTNLRLLITTGPPPPPTNILIEVSTSTSPDNECCYGIYIFLISFTTRLSKNGPQTQKLSAGTLYQTAHTWQTLWFLAHNARQDRISWLSKRKNFKLYPSLRKAPKEWYIYYISMSPLEALYILYVITRT
jgi:hypothetical protein